MSGFSVERLLLLLLLPLAAIVSARDLSKYPCTVFSVDVCFRLPVGTHVDYSVPSDFGLYRVLKDTKPVAAIYVGNAPQITDGPTAPSVSESTNWTIKIYRDVAAPVETLDIYITPKTKDVSIVHISAELNSLTHNELRELLSSLRPCKPVKSGGQKCPINSAWSKELTKIPMPSESEAES